MIDLYTPAQLAEAARRSEIATKRGHVVCRLCQRNAHEPQYDRCAQCAAGRSTMDKRAAPLTPTERREALDYVEKRR